MKKSRRNMTIALVLSLLTVFALPGISMAEKFEEPEQPYMSERRGGGEMRGPGRGGPHSDMNSNMPRGQWWRMPGVAEKLGLSKEEKEQLESLYMNNRREMINLKSIVESEKLEFEFLLDKEKIDESAVKAQFAKLHDARGKMSMSRFTFLLSVRKLLGYERYQTLKSEFQNRKMMRRGEKEERRYMRDDKGGPRR